MEKNIKKYCYVDGNFQLHEMKRFRSKVTAVIIISVLVCLSGYVLINHLMQNVFGLNVDQVTVLTNENKILQDRVASLTSRADELHQTVEQLASQGNQLRLMVDLPQMDREVSGAGTGGAVNQPDVQITSDKTSQMLNAALTKLRQLNGEIAVQQQSYKEVMQKYEFNKGYFKALPALKPMEGYYSPNDFGIRMHPVLGIFKAHEGLDIINDVGTPVYAAGDGVVEMAGQSGGGYGIEVVINHGYDYETLYGHLSKVFVHEGQHVQRGDMIAHSGNTGLVSGPHLHYEVRYKGVCRNPVDYFLDDVRPGEYKSSVASR
jgi:murein DD-endopeptidase MepM/ murein hydrolase activator NlpD